MTPFINLEFLLLQETVKNICTSDLKNTVVKPSNVVSL